MISTQCCTLRGEINMEDHHCVCEHPTPEENGVTKYLTRIPPEYWTWTEEEQLAFWGPNGQSAQNDVSRAALDQHRPEAKP